MLDKLQYGNEGARQKGRFALPAMTGDYIDQCCREAARLLAPLTRWRRYDTTRRDAMRDALRRIEAADAISKDVYEVVSKALQGDG